MRGADGMRVALGFRTHLGWAAMVALGGKPSDPRVVARERVELRDPAVPESLDPYHAARGLDPVEAEGVVHQGSEAALAATRRSVRAAVERLRADGARVEASCILTAAGRLPPTLERILASHAMVHVAEGELFRRALSQASERCALAVVGLPEREAFERAADASGLPARELGARIDGMGRELGPPWQKDQKLATAAAWFALAGLPGL